MAEGEKATIGHVITQGIIGAFKVARGNFDGYRHFSNTIDGFWQSFLAAPLTLPIRVLLLAGTFSLATETLSSNMVFLVETIGFLIDWIVFPLLMIPITRMMNITNRYVPFIIAYNWTKLPIYLAVSLALFIAMSPGEGAMNPLGGMLVLLAGGWSFWLRWRVAKDMLEITGLNAAVIVLFDTGIAIVMSGLIAQMIGPATATG
ncbi:MAG: hypothetical protein ACPG1C_01865 [Alphaproteobacteria bacterium]